MPTRWTSHDRPPRDGTGPPAPDGGAPPRPVLLGRPCLRLLLLPVLLGVPIALAAFCFGSLQHWLQREVWEELPRSLGHAPAPWWWPLPTLALAGLILAPIVTRMPGGSGHHPAQGLRGTPTNLRKLPGVALAAHLPLGVVLGSEAPLMAVGSALALLTLRAVRRTADRPTTAAVATAGSTAAVSPILGEPLPAADGAGEAEETRGAERPGRPGVAAGER
ncbi:hypothetical protein [Streptomyces sp. NPDC014006]|uniref:hypothetical protein n=1 Tax=Streptomyces sp. NPDC014006 TaxID=3364870 RepID=UPI0036FFB090